MTQRPHQLRTVVLGDRPEAWAAAGFTLDGTDTLNLGHTTLALDGSGRGFVSWRLDDVDADIDGLATTPPHATPAEVRAGPAEDPGKQRVCPVEHPNGIVAIDHVVVRTGDCERTIAAMESAGLEVRGGRSTTSYGSPMRQTFFWAGDVILELVGPDSGEPTTDEPTSVFGLALVASDIDATARALGPLLGTPKDAVQPGRRIAGLRGQEVGISLPIAVMSPHPG